jgi:para-aminobenzoate synthetase/4-amino-4-deoxychorismate lyase
LRTDITLSDLFHAIFPSGSVTGAPKIRTMEIIHELESAPRGVYTGGIGFFSPDGDIELNVPIRTLVLENNKGEMGIGSGIVYDSDAEKEWEECLLKGHFLTQPKQDFELIETILWQPGKGYWLLAEHLDRLHSSAHYFDFQTSRATIHAHLTEFAKGFNNASPQRVRLLLKKDGRIFCKNTPCQQPARTTMEPLDKDGTTQHPRIMLSSRKTNSQSPFLYHKTTQRGFYDTEREQAVQDGYFEVLFTNEKDELTEGAITNIFIRKNDMLLTPSQECGLLNGVFRRYLMEQSGTLTIREAVLTVKDLESADAIYVGNSVRGLVQVSL